MTSLEEVPFKTPLGPLQSWGIPGEVALVTAPELPVPDYSQILRDTEYEFTLENWVMTGGRYTPRETRPPVPQKARFEEAPAPSCPPYRLMFLSPQESRWASRWNSDMKAPAARPRSHSLSSMDMHHLKPQLIPGPQHMIRFVMCDSDDEAGYSEDDEGSSAEESAGTRRGGSMDGTGERLRMRGSVPKHQSMFRVREHYLECSGSPWTHHHSNPTSPRGRCPDCRRQGLFQGPDQGPGHTSCHGGQRRCGEDCRQQDGSSSSGMEDTSVQVGPSCRGQDGSPMCHGANRHYNRKRHHSSCSRGRKFSSTLTPARPSSAGPVIKNHRQMALRPRSSHGLSWDPSAELLEALCPDERELLEAITDQGYPLHAAVLALQKTGCRSPQQILSYLVASNRLCALGYDRALVEEAMEMFQNCESKAGEFLHLLVQFNEMGFQQSAIKEVLLVHENHRERALEELMTRHS